MMYRNKKLLQLAKKVPVCMCCGKPSDGTIVACHSDQQLDGKGCGIKAHDFRIFYGCSECNGITDNKRYDREQKRAMFENAHRKTIGWLFLNGHLEVK